MQKKKPNIGIALWNLNAKNLAEKSDRIAGWGFNCVSFLGGYFEDEFAADIASRIKKHGLKVTFHLSFFGKNKERALRELDGRIERITTLLKNGGIRRNAKCICFDPAYFYKNKTVSIDFETTIAALKKLDGKVPGIKIGVENWILNSPVQEMARIKAGVGRAKTGMLLDLGHLNIAFRQGLIKEADYLSYFKALPFKIIELHVHDNDGKTDLHLPPGRGNTEFAKIFKALKASGKLAKNVILTFEIKPRMKDIKIADKRKMNEVLRSKRLIERLYCQ